MGQSTSDIKPLHGDCIASNIPARAFRYSCENKNVLSEPGSMYVGTGLKRKTVVRVKTNDGPYEDQTFDSYVTSRLCLKQEHEEHNGGIIYQAAYQLYYSNYSEVYYTQENNVNYISQTGRQAGGYVPDCRDVWGGVSYTRVVLPFVSSGATQSTSDTTPLHGDCIANNIPARAFRYSCENKNVLSEPGSMYVGTGLKRKTVVRVKTNDGPYEDQTFDSYVTGVYYIPNDYVVDDGFSVQYLTYATSYVSIGYSGYDLVYEKDGYISSSGDNGSKLLSISVPKLLLVNAETIPRFVYAGKLVLPDNTAYGLQSASDTTPLHGDCIANNMLARPFRYSCENKNVLSESGSMYVGTGLKRKTVVKVKTNDGSYEDQTFDSYVTGVLKTNNHSGWYLTYVYCDGDQYTICFRNTDTPVRKDANGYISINTDDEPLTGWFPAWTNGRENYNLPEVDVGSL